jgi:hypothetical protein
MLIPHVFRIREDQDEKLRTLPGSISDHVRRAIDEYLIKQKPDIAISASKRGDENG